MALVIFDLDHTLIAGDSDHLWGEFLVEQAVVDPIEYKQANDRFYTEYKNGTLDILEYLHFALKPLSAHPVEQLRTWRAQFVEEKIKPIMQPKALECIEQHKAKGDTLMIITATNHFVTQPIAALHGIEHLLAVKPEVINGRYTGEIIGEPTFRAGKTKALSNWLQTHPHEMTDSTFYSDSINDLPLLEKVGKPIVVDGDTRLATHAQEQGWKIMSFRN